MPRVELTGTVDPTQFWPRGESDADTVVVTVREVRVDGQPTDILDGAYVLNHGEVQPVVRGGCVRVRLEGLDAPELHFPTTEPEPRALANATFRQARGGQCAAALGEALGGEGLLRCRALTEVEMPGDVFDVYGRFVGEVIVDTSGPGTLNVNDWLLQNGYALPAIYTSASRGRAKKFVELAREAKRFGRGVWRAYTDELYFDSKLVHRGTDRIEERGAVVFPKLFRRMAVWRVRSGAGYGLRSWMAERRPGDRVVPLDSFLAQGTAGLETQDLASFVSDDGVRPRFEADPFRLAFVERAGTTYDREGRPLEEFR